MNESELVNILNRFFSQGITLSIYSYIGAAVITFVGGALGTYATSYYKKNGEISALKFRLDDTIQQLKKQTSAVKKVEAEITNQSWVEQQRWMFRKDLYLSIIDLLIDAREETLKLDDMLNSIKGFCFDENSELHESEQEEIWGKNVRMTLDSCHEFVSDNIEPIKKKIALLVNRSGRLFLNPEVMKILAEFYNSQDTWYDKELQEQGFDINEVSSPYDLPMGPTEEGELAHYSKAAKDAYGMIIKEARKDLKIDLSVTSKK